jgi:hypothetical protein
METTMQGVKAQTPITEQLKELQTPEQFRAWLEGKWDAVRSIANCVSEQVERQKLTPIEGGSCVSAIVASVFGYKEFHGELSPSNLAAFYPKESSLR